MPRLKSLEANTSHDLAIVVSAVLIAIISMTASAATFRLGVTSFPPSRGNPFITVSTTSTFVLANIYDSLVIADNDGKLHPALAESWEMRDPLTWVFHLRPNVTYSNGERWDAAAAKAVLDFLREGSSAGNTFARDFSRLAAVNVEDSLTLVIKTTAPNLLLPQHMLFVFFVAPGRLAEVGMSGLAAEPIGTGSYKVARWGAAQLNLEAFAGSWRKPIVDRLEILALPDATSREQALLTDRVDVGMALNPDQVQTLEAAGARLYQRKPQRITAMIFDTLSPKSPFRDVRVRQAMNFAVNRDAICRNLLGGMVSPVSQPALDIALGFNPDLEPYPYDPAHARELLVHAGYPDGFSFVYEFAPNTLPNDSAIIQQIAADLDNVNVHMTILPLTFPQYARNVTQGGWKGFAWSMDYANYFHDALKPFYESLHSCAWYAPWFCDPAIEARVKAAAESPDLAARTTLSRDLMRYYRDIAQSLFLYPVLGLDGVGPRVTHWQPWGDILMLHTATLAAD